MILKRNNKLILLRILMLLMVYKLGLYGQDMSLSLAKNQGAVTEVGIGDQGDIAVDSKGNVHLTFARFSLFTSHFQTFGTTPNRYTVIQWHTYHTKDKETVKFQIVLHENGLIDFNIADITGALGESPITGVNLNGEHGNYLGANYPPSYPPPSQTSYRFIWNGVDDYTWTGIVYQWIDARGGKPVWIEWDDSSAKIPIGFDFTFYGETYNEVNVSSNGYISFVDDNAIDHTNPFIFPSSMPEAEKVIAPLWDDWNPVYAPDRFTEIYYAMIDGNTSELLIAPTMVSVWDTIPSIRPTIALDSEDMAHIIWADERWDHGESTEITYTKLDPYSDDRNGNGAVECNFTVIDDTRLTNIGEWVMNPRVVIDNLDRLHIVWENAYEAPYYMQIDHERAFINVTPVLLKDISTVWESSVDIATDSQNNVHITWNDQENTMLYETYYKMLDGDDGSTLIDATLVTEDDNRLSKSQTIAVDEDDNIHIVWMDERNGSNEVFHTKLNPSLDDQDGSVANAEAITLIEDQRIGAAGQDVHRAACSSAQSNNIHVCWWNEADKNTYFTAISKEGIVTVPEVQLTDACKTGTIYGWTMPFVAEGLSGSSHMIWFDWQARGLYYTSYSAPVQKNTNVLSNNKHAIQFGLLSNYPNPFNPVTTIQFNLDKASIVQVQIYDIHGRKIRTLANSMMQPGSYQLEWNGKDMFGNVVSGGTYFCKLSTSDKYDVRKLLLIK